MTEYLPIGGLFILMITSIIAIKVSLKDKISHVTADKKFASKEICMVTHKAVDEKLACIPEIREDVVEIKTKINMLLEKNGG